ncbi:MAG: DNA-binding NarL/FixJ family response regulator [bacterium]|jgi:DNA-binding NarL/FixJ family response regulator
MKKRFFLKNPKIINPYFILLEENSISALPLTLREINILQYLNEGFKNKQISENLFISCNTVKTHIKNIYIKLNVNKRIALKEKTLFLSYSLSDLYENR